MNKTTQEIMESLNTLIEFRQNIDYLLTHFPDAGEDVETIDTYVTYEIKKTLKDLIHIERL